MVRIQDYSTANLIAGNHLTELEEFQLFNVDMGQDENGKSIPDDLWYYRGKSRQGDLGDTTVSMQHADMTQSARQKRVEALEKAYAVMIPLELSVFPEPKEVLTE